MSGRQGVDGDLCCADRGAFLPGLGKHACKCVAFRHACKCVAFICANISPSRTRAGHLAKGRVSFWESMGLGHGAQALVHGTGWDSWGHGAQALAVRPSHLVASQPSSLASSNFHVRVSSTSSLQIITFLPAPPHSPLWCSLAGAAPLTNSCSAEGGMSYPPGLSL